MTHDPTDGNLSLVTFSQDKGQSPVTKTEPRSKMACPPGKEAAMDKGRGSCWESITG